MPSTVGCSDGCDHSEYIRLKPDDAEGYDQRANCYDKLAERDRAKAKELRDNKPPSSRLRPEAGQ
jgi:hypothetical protein